MMTSLKNLLTARRWILPLAVLAVVMTIPVVAHAGIKEWIGEVFGTMTTYFVRFFGYILILLTGILIDLAQYSNFVAPGPTAVKIGWQVARDLANMFFILILLIIAFGTILSYGDYHYKKLLPRLLIMSVVINFSKTICGIFIDLGQVVMLTFVNGFAQAAAGNMMSAFQIDKLMNINAASGGAELSNVVLGFIFAGVMIVIADMIVLTLVCMLAFRIVYLWVLIIVSPIAFLTSAFPPAAETYKKWWAEFKKYIISGPQVAFFLWLALVTAQQAGQGGGNIAKNDSFIKGSGDADIAANSGAISAAGIPTDAASKDAILSMIIFIALLLAGLKQASESGVAGVSIANNIKGRATKFARSVGGFAGRQALKPVKAASAGALTKLGGGLAASRIGALAGLGRMAALQGERMKEKRKKDLEGRYGSLEDVARLSPSRFNSIARNATGKQAQEIIQLAQKDKRAMNLLKGDEVAIRNLYAQGKTAIDGNPNFRKDAEGFTDTFATELHKPKNPEDKPLIEADRFKSAFQKKGLDDLFPEALKANAEELSAGQARNVMQNGRDDQKQAILEGLAGKDIGKFLEDRRINAEDIPKSWYGAAGVADYALKSTRNDARSRDKILADTSGSEALRNASKSALTQAVDAEGNNNQQVLNATLQGLQVGSITADNVMADTAEGRAIRAAAAGPGFDAGALKKALENAGTEQKAAGQMLMAAAIAGNPKRKENYEKNGMYEMPSDAQVEAVVKITGEADVVAAAQSKIAALDKKSKTTEGAEGAVMTSAEDRAMRDKIQGLVTAFKNAASQLETSKRQLEKLKSAPTPNVAAVERLSRSVSENEQRVARASADLKNV